MFADSADMLEAGWQSRFNNMRNTINSNTGVQLLVIFGTHQAISMLHEKAGGPGIRSHMTDFIRMKDGQRVKLRVSMGE